MVAESLLCSPLRLHSCGLSPTRALPSCFPLSACHHAGLWQVVLRLLWVRPIPWPASLCLPASLGPSRSYLSCGHGLRASPGKRQDVYCTATSSTHEAYVEFFGLRNSRVPRPPHMPSGDSLRAWLAVPLSPSFRSFVGHEFTVGPGQSRAASCFPQAPLDSASFSFLSW